MEVPQVVVISIINEGDKFLLVKRAREPFKDCWSIIGGLSIMNEKYSSDPLEASKDEVRGDIQCEFVNPKFYKYIFSEEEKPTLSLIFSGQIKGEPMVNTKYATDCKWFSIKEIENLDLAFEHKEMLQRFYER